MRFHGIKEYIMYVSTAVFDAAGKVYVKSVESGRTVVYDEKVTRYERGLL
jgi:hypothetical protein